MRIVVACIVVTSIRVEDYLTLPRLHITHLQSALYHCVETAVGKGTAPILVNVNSNYILLTAYTDKVLLLVGQLVNLIVVPSVLVALNRIDWLTDVITILILFIDIVIMVDVVTGSLPYEDTVDVILSRSIVVTASQINIAGKHAGGSEGTTEIDVGNLAVSSPAERFHAVPCFVAAERSLLVFPVEVAVLGSAILVLGKSSSVILLLVPFVAVGIHSRPVFQNKHVIHRVLVTPVTIAPVGIGNKDLSCIRFIAPPC